MVDVNMINKGGKNMLCDKCGINQATIQYVQVINGDKTIALMQRLCIQDGNKCTKC